jgi:hypothetical protein
MATLDLSTASLVVSGGGIPRATPVDGARGSVNFDTPAARAHSITAVGSVVLRGREGEQLGGWALGYIQLKFIATDYARYRGNTVAEGSAKVSRSNMILCRDSDEGTDELWYDPIEDGIVDGHGTTALAEGTVMPASGQITLTSNFGDSPGRPFDNLVKNTITNADNFLYHADIGLQFCTMLTARDPDDNFRVLKHFYWNIRWEAHFQRDAAGIPQVRRPPDHFQLNIQRTVHSGVPDDPRFKGREFDNTLPISLTVSGRPEQLRFARDWSLG